MAAQFITAPSGERLAVVPEAEYLALVAAAEDGEDAAAVRRFREALAAGEEEFVPSAVADRLLAGESPIRVWREHRGFSAKALAAAAGLAAAYLSQLETGRRTGSVDTMRRLATALRVTIDDLA